MESRKELWSNGLPYVNNFPVVFLTVAINLACALIFFYGKTITRSHVMTDACICGVTTAFIDVFAIWHLMKELRARGKLPQKVPRSRLMAALPKNPAALASILAVIFGVLTPLVNKFLLWFYEISSIQFEQFAVWRTLYSTILSVYIVQIAIFRCVQPDCGDRETPQKGSSKVKNPLPRISTFKEWFNTVTDDFGLNLVLGLFLGGTVIEGKNVIIAPATLASIHYSAIALSLIVTARMVYPVARTLRNARDSGSLPPARETDRRISWIPESPAKFALVLLPPLMLCTYVFFRALMTFFGFDVLNFFQYFALRMLWTTMLTKAVTKLAVWRYLQPS